MPAEQHQDLAQEDPICLHELHHIREQFPASPDHLDQWFNQADHNTWGGGSDRFEK
jgi:hypothetical protein